MKNILLIVIICLFVFSCKSKKELILTDSKVFTDSIYSKYLKEYRKHTVYLPKGFNSTKSYPIIFGTDGGTSLTDKKAELDSLINYKIIKPIIFIASFSNNKIADSTSMTNGDEKKVYLCYRNFEYINDYASTTKDSSLAGRFKNHKSYFAYELIDHIERKYRQNNGKEYRYFYGVSNGAGFGLSLLNSKPELIGTYFCFSTFGGDIQTNIWNKKTKYPNLYLRYGSEEPFFLKEEAKILISKYAESNSFIEAKEFDGGHNNKFWKKEFIQIISRVLKTE
uniref:alpha/beta hydrolase n=1 Tax=Flavobacterium sp. TaxID=239 RepID=UPI00404B2274